MTAPAMLAVEAALEFLLDRARPIADTQNQHLLHARRCVLAQDIRASVDVPPCDNSAMDGYAVRSSDIQPERMLPISQRIPAGAVPGPLAEGSVARIQRLPSSSFGRNSRPSMRIMKAVTTSNPTTPPITSARLATALRRAVAAALLVEFGDEHRSLGAPLHAEFGQ